MTRPVSVMTFEVTVPLATNTLTERQVDNVSREIRKGVKLAFEKTHIPRRAIRMRTIVDDVSIKESNALVASIKENK